MTGKLFIDGSKVVRVSDHLSWMDRLKSQLTARNIIGSIGIVAFIVGVLVLIIGGA